jgi:isopenicillin N synthase-like dioxygenase
MKEKDFNTVPRISWKSITDESGHVKTEGAFQFGEALRLAGFAILTDSPFRSDLLENNYKLMKAVFGLGVEKLTEKYAHPEIGFQRGYMPTLTEVGVRCNNEPDDKQVMAFGSYHNVDVDEIPHYTKTVEEYYAACQDVGFTLMKVLALYFDPEGKETEYISGLFRDIAGNKTDDSHMRHICYPGTAKRMACAHTDSNMLTLLPAATGSGLELLNNKNEWMAVQTFKGDLVINAGDMLNFISGGKIRSTLHRVENKYKDPSQNRYSMPFFFHPDHSKALKILPSCKNGPVERRMFPYDKSTGYELLFELLNLYQVIPEGVDFNMWHDSMEKLKNEGF